MIAVKPGNFVKQGGGVWTPPGTVLAWSYGNNASGSDWADLSGNSNPISPQGTVSVGANGLTMPGGSGNYALHAVLGNELIATTGSTWSLAQWVLTDSTAAEQRSITIMNAANVTAFLFRVIAGGDLQAFNGTSLLTIGSLSASTWAHLAASCNAGTITLYVNGTAHGTTFAATRAGNSNQIRIGTDAGVPTPGNIWDGYIDDVLLATSAWSAADVADIYNNSPGAH